MNIPGWIVVLGVGLLGLIFGSFANVIIWRLPRGESLNFPGSHCPSCETPIAWYDNVPVLGWIILRGRCRSCGISIPVRYPVVEALTAVLWLSALLTWGMTWRALFASAFFYVLLVLSFIDLDTMRLPNVLVGIEGLIGLLGIALGMFLGTGVVPLIDGAGVLANPVVFAGLGLLAGGLVPLAFSAAYRLIRGVQGIGFGDVKLLGVMGLFLGPYVLLCLFFGSLIGAVVSVALGRGRGMERRIPFGPYLALGAVATALVGPWVVDWYLSVL